MTKRSDDDSPTVLTYDSSLRNVDYEPSYTSQQESVDGRSLRSDGNSAISSVLSSVKRNLRGGVPLSTQSFSTRQSEGMLWQDSESENEQHSFSADEGPGSCAGQFGKAAERRPDFGSDSSFHVKGQDTRMTAKAPTLHESSKKGCDKSCPTGSTGHKKRLRFSSEAFGLVAQSRINETRHTVHLKPSQDFGRLIHVEYLTEMEVATNDQDISTLHPLGKEECDEVFNNSIELVVPVCQESSDDMPSILGLPTVATVPAVPLHKPDTRTTQQDENDDIEKGVLESTVTAKTDKVSMLQTKEVIPPLTIMDCLCALVLDHSGAERFFITLVGVSLATLIVLLVILFVT